MENSTEYSCLQSSLNLAQRSINFDEYGRVCIEAQEALSDLKTIDDTINKIVDGLNEKHDDDEAYKWCHRLNATLFTVAMEEYCSEAWQEHFFAVVNAIPVTINTDFYFELMLRHNWIPHFINIACKLESPITTFTLFFDFLNRTTTQMQTETYLELLKHLVLYDNDFVYGTLDTDSHAFQIVNLILGQLDSFQVQTFGYEAQMIVVSACLQLLTDTPQFVLKNPLRYNYQTTSSSSNSSSNVKVTLENMEDYIRHPDSMVKQLAELVTQFDVDSYTDLHVEKLLTWQQIGAVKTSCCLVKNQIKGPLDDVLKMTVSKILSAVECIGLNADYYKSQMTGFMDEYCQHIGSAPLFQTMEILHRMKIHVVQMGWEDEDECFYDKFLTLDRAGSIEAVEYSHFCLAHRSSGGAGGGEWYSAVPEITTVISSAKNPIMLDHDRYLQILTENQKLFTTPQHLRQLLENVRWVPSPTIQSQLNLQLKLMCEELSVEDLNALIGELGACETEVDLEKHEDFLSDLTESCNRMSMDAVDEWAKKLGMLFLQDADATLDEMIVQSTTSPQQPELITKILTLVPALTRWPLRQETELSLELSPSKESEEAARDSSSRENNSPVEKESRIMEKHSSEEERKSMENNSTEEERKSMENNSTEEERKSMENNSSEEERKSMENTSSEEERKSVFVAKLSDYMLTGIFSKKQKVNFITFVLKLLQTSVDGGPGLLSLQTFLSKCMLPLMHKHCQHTPQHNQQTDAPQLNADTQQLNKDTQLTEDTQQLNRDTQQLNGDTQQQLIGDTQHPNETTTSTTIQQQKNDDNLEETSSAASKASLAFAVEILDAVFKNILGEKTASATSKTLKQKAIKKRFEHEGPLSDVLVSYFLFFALLLEDLEHRDLMPEDFTVRSRAIDIVDLLQKTLANNVACIANPVWLYNRIEQHTWRTQCRAADLFEALCAAVLERQKEQQNAIPKIRIPPGRLPSKAYDILTSNTSTVSIDRMCYNIFAVVRLSDRMLNLMMEQSKSGQLEKQAINYMYADCLLALSLHLRRCTVEEGQRLASFVLVFLGQITADPTAARGGGDMTDGFTTGSQQESMRLRLSDMFLDAVLLLTRTAGVTATTWSYIIATYTAVIHEHVVGQTERNLSLLRCVLRHLVHALNSLAMAAADINTEPIFNLVLLTLSSLLNPNEQEEEETENKVKDTPDKEKSTESKERNNSNEQEEHTTENRETDKEKTIKADELDAREQTNENRQIKQENTTNAEKIENDSTNTEKDLSDTNKDLRQPNLNGDDTDITKKKEDIVLQVSGSDSAVVDETLFAELERMCELLPDENTKNIFTKHINQYRTT